MRRYVVAASLVAAATLITPSAAPGMTLYFKNKRAIEARSYEVKGHLIYVTMSTGRTVYMRADSVDWETTEKLKNGSFSLEGVAYDSPDAGGEGGEDVPGFGRPLTSSDLRKTGTGTKMRRSAAPTLAVEVPANGVWTDSQISVRAGQVINFRVTGSVTVSPGPTSGPEGSASRSAKPLVNEKPAGALLLRLGLGGAPTEMGRSLRFVAPAAGRLYFAVNDGTPEDNSGSFTVSVELPNPIDRVAPGTTGALSPGGAGTSGASAAPSAGGRPPAQGMAGAVDRARAAREAAGNRPTVP